MPITPAMASAAAGGTALPIRSRQSLEVAQAGRVHVDPAEADPFGLDVADPRTRPVEACGAAAEAAAEVEVVEGALDHAAGSFSRT
ncbi:TPA: hypothetical protein NDU46_003777 [Pseudomonas aeruginosa]|nr:hypothetical protein [Pseudomonas aeruginosa]